MKWSLIELSRIYILIEIIKQNCQLKVNLSNQIRS